MPIKLSIHDDNLELWNFYVDKVEKQKFAVKLLEYGYPKAQGAAIRTMMNLFLSDEEFRSKVINDIDKFYVYRKSGSMSNN